MDSRRQNIYLWFQCDLDRSTTHPKDGSTEVESHNIEIIDTTYHVLEALVLTTESSGIPHILLNINCMCHRLNCHHLRHNWLQLPQMYCVKCVWVPDCSLTPYYWWLLMWCVMRCFQSTFDSSVMFTAICFVYLSVFLGCPPTILAQIHCFLDVLGSFIVNYTDRFKSKNICVILFFCLH